VTKSATEIPHYPSLTPMIYSKFLFSKIGFDAPHGFTLVSDRHVYTNGATLFGWGKGDSVKSTLIFGSRSLPFFRLSSHYADTPATFHALMHEGNYEVMIHAGTITSYYTNKKGREYKMTISANGEELVRDLVVESDKPYIGRFDVKVGKDNQLNIDFSGKWGVSVIEIYRK
ncbi:MAG: hypothetical protein SNH80_01835, partial [Rikenellaceae bacterium]